MNWIHTLLILALAFIAVFVQTAFTGLRTALGAQLDLLPALTVYASLSCGPVTPVLLAVFGGLAFDSQSANPLGISIFPLLLIAFVLQHYRGLILREQIFAQWTIGFAASAAAPLLTLLLLLNTDQQPLVGWFSLWQWVIVAAIGGALTPVWFYMLDWLLGCLSYQRIEGTPFRADREIKRGRM